MTQPRRHVDGGHPPAEEPEQQHQGHFVDHWRRDQEGERHAQRHAGGDEADEERHGRAGAERRDHAEQRRQAVPADSRVPARIRRVRSGVKKERTMPTPNTTAVSSRRTFGTSKTRNSTAEEKWVPLGRPISVYVSQPAIRLRFP